MVLAGCNLFSTDDEITYKDVDGGKKLSEYEGNSSHKELVIPAEYEGKPVVEIGEYAVSAAEYLESITIGKNVQKISYRAFCGTCKNLREYIVDEENPYFCSVDGVIFNKEMTTLIAYPNQRESKEYVVPEGVTKIESCAFYMCSNLEKVTLASTVTEIGDYSFFKCSGLKKIELNEGLRTVGRDGCSYCESFEELCLPSTLESIGDYGFYSTTSTALKTFTTKKRIERIQCGKSWRPQTTGMANSAMSPTYVGE